MAIGDTRLTTGQYLRPSAYIGFVFQARPVSPSGLPRQPVYVGRGSRLAQTLDFPITRSFLREVSLTFTLLAPHIATLQWPASNDQTVALLYTQAGIVLSNNDWAFRESTPGSGVFDQVEITLTKFDKNATYLIDYQSVSRDVNDDLSEIQEMRDLLAVGDAEGSPQYVENVDFRIVTDMIGDTSGGDPDALVRDSNNSDGTGVVGTIVPTLQGASTGAVAFNTANAFTYDYGLHYNLQCVAAGGVTPNRTATFQLTITHLSGGNDLDARVPPHPSSNVAIQFIINEGVNDTNYQLDTNYAFADGIRLDFTWGATNFIGNVTPSLADLFDWDAMGPQLIEFGNAYDNTNQFSQVTEPVENGNPVTTNPNSSSGEITLNIDTDYDDEFNRHYYLEVGSIVAGPPRQATILWAGWDELPFTYGSVTIQENTPATYTKVSIENGIYLDFDFGVRHLLSDGGDTLLSPDATDLTSAITLATEILTNTNQHDNDGLVVAHGAGTGTHQITAAVPIDEPSLVTFCLDAQTQYPAHISDAVMHNPIDTVFLLDSDITPSDTNSCILFLNDYKAKFNRHVIALHWVVGDTWLMTATAAWQYYQGKDDRDVTLTTTTVVAGTSVDFQYTSSTVEGGWGNVQATTSDPYLRIPDNITLAVRNFDPAGTLLQYVASDVFTFSAINEDEIDWSLRIRQTESIPSTEIRQDTLGRITGTPLAYYVALSETPETIIKVKDSITDTPLSYTWVQTLGGEPTIYISFGLSNPNTTVEVTYEYKGEEPAPGQVYYFSCNRVRADSEYEVPIQYLLRDDLNVGLRPSELTNHVWIMGNIAFDTGFFGCYICQVKSASGDEIYTNADYRRAIEATEKTDGITDLVVLSRHQVLGFSKNSVIKSSNPFVGRERLLWHGVPAGTPIGDEQTPDTLVYLAKRTLQITGNSPGRGRMILTGNQSAQRTITLDDGSASLVDLDGSFIAGYGAARTASFNAPWETLLRKDTGSFDTMAVFSDEEQILLGNASILWLNSAGEGVYRYEESHTVDTGSPDVNEISAMTQKDYVTRRVRSRLDANLIGIVPPSPAAGVTIIQSYLVEELGNLVSDGFVAPYGSEEDPPTTRDINPDSDTFVYVDRSDRRRYHIGYFFNIIYPIKWIMGLYSVDSRFWDNRSLSSAQ